MSTYLHPDLHMHSTVSDGTDTPTELLEKVRQTDIDIFSLTDHDAYDGCLQIQQQLRCGDPLFLGGIELSCKDELGKYHILGYCCDVRKISIRSAVSITHNARREKALNRIRYLQEVYGFSFPQEQIEALLKNENPGRPHFVSLLLKNGLVSDKAEGFRIIGNYHGKERRLTPEEAIDAILQADGIPVLAHGILADGLKKLTEAETAGRMERLKACGLMGAECYYSSYTDEQREIMLSLAARYNLMVTAGSDYHGTVKTVSIGQTGEVDPDRMSRFYRAVRNLLEL